MHLCISSRPRELARWKTDLAVMIERARRRVSPMPIVNGDRPTAGKSVEELKSK